MFHFRKSAEIMVTFQKVSMESLDGCTDGSSVHLSNPFTILYRLEEIVKTVFCRLGTECNSFRVASELSHLHGG